MAHRSTFVPVLLHLKAEEISPVVEDPVCGMQMPRQDVKHVLFQENGAFYFCSKECLSKFTSHALKGISESRYRKVA